MQAFFQALLQLASVWTIWLPLLVGGFAIYLLLPRPRPYPWYLGALAGGVALFLGASLLFRSLKFSPEVVLFYSFSFLAILGAALLVTQHNPARAALSFTLVILSTAGLFLLLGAPFLMAATIIIYAGAIIVTFLFVLMLAQQAGLSDADARSREPALATLTGFLLLAAILYVLQGYQQTRVLDDLIARIDQALEQQSREAMKAYVEPNQTEAEREREDHQLFKQSANLLESAGLKELARQARHASDAWILGEVTAQESLQDSRQALQKLRETLAPNRNRIAEQLTVARLPGTDQEAEAALAGRRGGAPMSSLSGPPPSTPAREIRRHPQTDLPELPAENAAFLGRSLFTDYLLPVELAGTLLLVATVGAIAIAQRRERASASPSPRRAV